MTMMLNDNDTNMSLGTLNKNITKFGRDLRRISSGQRIIGAGDGASEFAIGRKMQVLVRALGQDIDNSKKGTDLVNTAERGINTIIDELRNMKRLALDSANDHNTDADRATIQKEFASRMLEIDDIAATTNYNGIHLLDGRWGYHEYVEYKPGKCGCFPTNKNSCTCTTNKNSNTSNLAFNTLPNLLLGTTPILTTNLDSSHVVSSDSINSDIFSLNSLQSPVVLLGANNTNTTPVLEPDTGVTNNKIEGVFPPSPMGYSLGGILGYSPEFDWGKEITVRSSNRRVDASDLYLPMPGAPGVYFQNMAAPNENTTYYVKESNNEYVPVKIRQDADGITAINQSGPSSLRAFYLADFTFANATFYGNQLNLPTDLNNQSISILCTGCYQFISIKLEADRPAGTGVRFEQDPNVTSRYRNAVAYAIGIGKDATTEEAILANVFKGIQNAQGINDPTANYVNLDPNGHQVILYHDSSSNSYSFYKTEGPAPVFLNGGVGTLVGGGEEIYGTDDPGGDDTIPGGDDTVPGGDDTVPGGDDTVPGGDDTVPGGDDTVPGGDDTNSCECIHETVSRFEGNPLVIHTGPKANQLLYVYIKCMKSEAMGLKNVGVETREKALDSLGKLDFALEYALNESTQMGAYQNRLAQTIETLTIRNENTISAESVITDADMAKEMTSYVKHNILVQSAQAMLAQANQKREGVLSLLQ